MAALISDPTFLIAQAFGFAAMATAISMYQFKKHRTIMLLMVLCSGLWCAHFAFLGSATGVVMNVINVARSLVYTRREKPGWDKAWIPAVFVAASVITVIFTWDGIWSILPCAASVCATMGSWQKNTQRLRLYTVGVCLGWFFYNLVHYSVAGMVNEVFTLTSVLIALWRYRFRPEKTEEAARPPAE